MIPIVQHWGPVLVGLLAATSIVIGAHLALRSKSNTAMSTRLIRVFAFGTGSFFAAVCLDFLPDAWSANGDNTPDWVFLGALVMWAATHLSDGFFQQAQSGGGASEDTVDLDQGTTDSPEDIPLTFTRVSAIVLAAALSFHTFFEGAAVSFSFHDLNTRTLGFSLAIVLHKLPEGVLWGLALSAVFPEDVTKIKRILVIPAVCTLVGVFLGINLALQASSQALDIAVGFVAGAMLYIAFAELLPALRETTQPLTTRIWFIVGLVMMFILNTASNVFGG